MIDKDILEGLAELNETDLKRIKLLVDNKLNLHKDINVSYRSKNIKCGNLGTINLITLPSKNLKQE